MQTRIESRDGWIEVSRDGICVLAKGDAALAVRLDAALASADGDDLVDVVTDELSIGGIRRTPDFALVDQTSLRALVRGSATVQISGSDGATRVILAPTRGPWADEDLENDLEEIVLATGEVDPEPEVPADPEAPLGSPATPVASGASTGWAMPSVFAAPSNCEPSNDESANAESANAESADGPLQPPAEAPTLQQPVEQAEIVETPAPSGTELVGDEPAQDEELPSFDFLFGNTNHHRSSLMSPGEDADAQEAPIDSGPVAAAGGFQAPDDDANATLAPPSDEDEQPEQEPTSTDPTVAAMPGGLPPMPGSAPFAETADETPADPTDAGQVSPPDGDGPHAWPRVVAPRGPSLVQAARDDSTGHEPGSGSPQFADGHLVGSRVPQAATQSDAAPVDSGPAPSQDSAPAEGVISEVPWGGQAPARGPNPGLPFGLPGLPTPDVGPGQPQQESAPQANSDEPESESGPMVLSVRCSVGHHNAPHATRCRVCGQDLPTQQPEPTLRPALGLLRLSTGDVVTLDRGVLIGRAPRPSETSGPRSPHLVRISSPDNEISRNHVEIVLDGWHVLVRDLGSTNGTTVALPGSSPVRVRPGDQQTIEPGSTITLADQISMVFEVTG